MKVFFENSMRKTGLVLTVRNKLPRRWSLLIKTLIFLSLSAHLLATRHPLVMVYKDHLWFPAFSSLISSNRVEQIADENGQLESIVFEHIDWKALQSSFVIWAPIPWSANIPDSENRNFKSPFERQLDVNAETKGTTLSLFFRHHLGTDALGNDVFAGLIHGLGNSMFIALCSTLIALFIGLFLGLTAGYWGDHLMQTTLGNVIAGTVGIVLGFFWAFQMRINILREAAKEGFIEVSIPLLWSVLIFILTLGIFLVLGKYLSKLKWLDKHVHLPYDGAVQRFSEVFNSLPKLLLILTLSAAFDAKNMWLLILILGSLQWTGIARLARIETMKLRKMPFVEAALLQGYSTPRILLVHLLPSIIGVLLVEATFVFAGSVLIESSLSFLGLGLPDTSYTLGSILKNGRNHPTAWWMTVFPGLLIFMLTYTANRLGKWLQSNFTHAAETYQSP
jgi:peptide/nickel transport system permease protein